MSKKTRVDGDGNAPVVVLDSDGVLRFICSKYRGLEMLASGEWTLERVEPLVVIRRRPECPFPPKSAPPQTESNGGEAAS